MKVTFTILSIEITIKYGVENLVISKNIELGTDIIRKVVDEDKKQNRFKVRTLEDAGAHVVFRRATIQPDFHYTMCLSQKLDWRTIALQVVKKSSIQNSVKCFPDI